MIWLTWRQLRMQAAVLGAAAAALAVALLITGLGASDLADETGAGFIRALGADGAKTTALNAGLAAVVAVPAIVGVFCGAPLVARELEAGTHRLAWNQSVTRSRWLATKMGVTGLAAVALAGLLGLAVAWWFKPIDAAILAGHGSDGILGTPRMLPAMFMARGIVPIGYAAFAFALGVAAGAVVRRTVPAMAITLAVFVLVLIAIPTVRAHLAPATLTTRITQENFRGLNASIDASGRPNGPVKNLTVAVDKPGAWIVANETVDASGAVVDELPSWMASCLPPPPAPGEGEGGPTLRPAGADGIGACLERLTAAGYRQRVGYQPAGRFWTFQAIETAFFLGLAGLVTAFTFWWVRKRLA